MGRHLAPATGRAPSLPLAAAVTFAIVAPVVSVFVDIISHSSAVGGQLLANFLKHSNEKKKRQASVSSETEKKK